MSDDYNTSHSNLAPTSQNGAQEVDQQEAANQRQLEGGRPSPSSQLHQDEMQQDLTYLSREAPLDGGESTFGGAASYSQLAGPGSHREESVMHLGSEYQEDENEDYMQREIREQERQLALNQLAPDNVDIQRPMQQAG